jgi:hypothetical protein
MPELLAYSRSASTRGKLVGDALETRKLVKNEQNL